MLKKGFYYIVINYIIQFLNIILSLFLMRYLNAIQLGDLALAKTWQQFIDYSHLGSRFAMDRFIPVEREKDRKLFVVSVLFITILGSLLVLSGAVVFSDSNITVVILSLCGVFISLSNIFKAYYRAIDSITRMLQLVLVTQLLPVLIPLVIYALTRDFTFFLYSTLLCYSITVLKLLYTEKELIHHFVFKTVISKIKLITRASALLFINSLLTFLYLVMDRFFIDHVAGRDALGNYSVIVFAFSALMIIPATCAELIFVKIIKQCTEKKRRLFLSEGLLMLAITVTGIVIANLIMEYFIKNYTAYQNLIPQMHLATLAVIPFSLTAIYYHVMNGLDLRNEMIIVSAVVTVLLCIYYSIPVLSNGVFTLDYYIYAKMATGWVILAGYSWFIIRHRR